MTTTTTTTTTQTDNAKVGHNITFANIFAIRRAKKCAIWLTDATYVTTCATYVTTYATLSSFHVYRHTAIFTLRDERLYTSYVSDTATLEAKIYWRVPLFPMRTIWSNFDLESKHFKILKSGRFLFSHLKKSEISRKCDFNADPMTTGRWQNKMVYVYLHHTSFWPL